jgi:hypothetical protein
LSDLLVQPMPHAGIFERYQQLAAAANGVATGSTMKHSMPGKHSMSGSSGAHCDPGAARIPPPFASFRQT